MASAPISTFTRKTYNSLASEVPQALKEIADKYGIDFTLGSFSTGEEAMVTMHIKVRDVGNGVSAAQANWERYAPVYGLKPEWFGRLAKISGTIYEVAGINATRPKNCIQIKHPDGRIYMTTVATLKSVLGT